MYYLGVNRVGVRSLALAPARGKSKPNLTATAHSPCATAVLKLRQDTLSASLSPAYSNKAPNAPRPSRQLPPKFLRAQ